jgi:hypothetical protein
LWPLFKKCVEEEFCELRVDGVLKSSLSGRNFQATANVRRLGDVPECTILLG